MKKIFNILLIFFFISLFLGIYTIRKYENLYIKNVTDSAIYFQNPSRTLLKVNCLFDEAIFNISNKQNIKQSQILLFAAKNLLKNETLYEELIKIINIVLDDIKYQQHFNSNQILKRFHKKINEISFVEFERSIKYFEAYKANIKQFQIILYTIIAIVLLLSIALLIILYQSKLLRKIKILSETDQLTKAFNRRKFFEEISNLEEEYSIIMFDIDHFKKINDTYGHDKGDYVLKYLIELIKKHIRKDDMIFRWGGEEFFILFKNMNISEAQVIAKKLRKIVEENDFDGLTVTISVSVVSSKNTHKIDKIIKTLDEGLYEAKNSGRNRVVIKGKV